MQPTEITVKDGRKLIVVEVPKYEPCSITKDNTLIYSLPDSQLRVMRFNHKAVIIGTLHYNPEPVFDFDTEQFVKRHPDNSAMYKDSFNSEWACFNKNDALLSLLRSYGIGYRENPLDEKPNFRDYQDDDAGCDWTQFYKDEEAWQKAEEGVLRQDKQYVFIEVKP